LTISSGLGQRVLTFPNMGENLVEAKKYRADKSRAYREGFDEFVKTAVRVNIAGKQYLAHNNVNLYVDMTQACNADCNFCIAKVNFTRNSKPINTEFLNKALDALSDVKPSVQITGGEPTLFPTQLKRLVDTVNERKPKRPVINTNGTNLLECTKFIADSKIEHVNISRHHYNETNNNKVMEFRGPGITNNYLAEAIAPIKERVRVQCNFLDGEIDTYGEVMQFIAYCYHKLNVRNVAFAQLTPLPDDSFYAPSIIKVIKDAPVDVDAILARVDTDSRFQFEKYRGGVACYYEVWKFLAYEEPMTIIFKYSDNQWLEKADADPLLLPDLVLHTDGTLAGSWCKDRKFLTKFD